MDYQRLSYMSGDVVQEYNKKIRSDLPWILQNMLPSTFELYLVPQFRQIKIPLGSIEPRKQRIFPPHEFKDGDILIVTYKWDTETFNEETHIMPNHVFNSAWKHIRLGDVNYDSSRGRQAIFPDADISGIMLNNCLHFPLDVFFKGTLVAQLESYDGMTHMGGSGSSLYYDNHRQGFNLGDQITFAYSMVTDRSEMYTITLTDNHVYNVNIGVIGVGTPSIMPDVFNYEFHVVPEGIHKFPGEYKNYSTC